MSSFGEIGPKLPGLKNQTSYKPPNVLPMANGGTGAVLAANTGALIVSNSTDTGALEMLANPGVSGKLLASQSGASPIWTVSTWPTGGGTTNQMLVFTSSTTIGTATNIPVGTLANTVSSFNSYYYMQYGGL